MNVKRLTFFFWIISISIVLGQTIDNTIYLTAMNEVQKSEFETLNEVEGWQEQLTYASAAMSVSSVLFVNSEQKLHQGLVLVYDVIDNANVIYQIINTSQKIMTIQDRILEVAQRAPIVAPLAAYKEIIWIEKASVVLLNLLQATKETSFNIMSNSQRLTLLDKVVQELKLILLETNKLYRTILSYESLSELTPEEVFFSIDLTVPIQRMEEKIQNLIIE